MVAELWSGRGRARDKKAGWCRRDWRDWKSSAEGRLQTSFGRLEIKAWLWPDVWKCVENWWYIEREKKGKLCSEVMMVVIVSMKNPKVPG